MRSCFHFSGCGRFAICFFLALLVYCASMRSLGSCGVFWIFAPVLFNCLFHGMRYVRTAQLSCRIFLVGFLPHRSCRFASLRIVTGLRGTLFIVVSTSSRCLFSRLLHPRRGAYVTMSVAWVCASSCCSVIWAARRFIRPIILICCASSWRIATATPAMYFRGVIVSGFAFGFWVADPVMILGPLHASSGSFGVCVLDLRYVYFALCQFLRYVKLWLFGGEVVRAHTDYCQGVYPWGFFYCCRSVFFFLI